MLFTCSSTESCEIISSFSLLCQYRGLCSLPYCPPTPLLDLFSWIQKLDQSLFVHM